METPTIHFPEEGYVTSENIVNYSGTHRFELPADLEDDLILVFPTDIDNADTLINFRRFFNAIKTLKPHKLTITIREYRTVGYGSYNYRIYGLARDNVNISNLTSLCLENCYLASSIQLTWFTDILNTTRQRGKPLTSLEFRNIFVMSIPAPTITGFFTAISKYCNHSRRNENENNMSVKLHNNGLSSYMLDDNFNVRIKKIEYKGNIETVELYNVYLLAAKHKSTLRSLAIKGSRKKITTDVVEPFITMALNENRLKEIYLSGFIAKGKFPSQCLWFATKNHFHNLDNGQREVNVPFNLHVRNILEIDVMSYMLFDYRRNPTGLNDIYSIASNILDRFRLNLRENTGERVMEGEEEEEKKPKYIYKYRKPTTDLSHELHTRRRGLNDQITLTRSRDTNRHHPRTTDDDNSILEPVIMLEISNMNRFIETAEAYIQSVTANLLARVTSNNADTLLRDETLAAIKNNSTVDNTNNKKSMTTIETILVYEPEAILRRANNEPAITFIANYFMCIFKIHMLFYWRGQLKDATFFEDKKTYRQQPNIVKFEENIIKAKKFIYFAHFFDSGQMSRVSRNIERSLIQKITDTSTYSLQNRVTYLLESWKNENDLLYYFALLKFMEDLNSFSLNQSNRPLRGYSAWFYKPDL